MDELLSYLKENGERIRRAIMVGTSRPQPVRRVEIPKSEGGEVIGYTRTVDIDLARYFDTVNHDKLKRLLSEKIKDGRVLSLIMVRKYLNSGIMINGAVIDTEEGTSQGPQSIWFNSGEQEAVFEHGW